MAYNKTVMPKKIEIKDASSLDIAILLSQLEEGSPIQLVQRGKPKVVLIKFRYYQAMLQKLEDLEDILAAREAFAAPNSEVLTLEEYEQHRKAKVHR